MMDYNFIKDKDINQEQGVGFLPVKPEGGKETPRPAFLSAGHIIDCGRGIEDGIMIQMRRTGDWFIKNKF